MIFADGHPGRLATGYDVVRAILADSRFSIRRELAHPPVTMPNSNAQAVFTAPAPPGMFVRMDPPEHLLPQAPGRGVHRTQDAAARRENRRGDPRLP